MKKVAIIRIRGKIGLKKNIKDTLNMLRLYNKNYCIVIDNKPQNIGMIKKVKDYITWGEIEENTLNLLLKERGKLPGNKKLKDEYLKEKLKTDIVSFAKEVFESKRSLKDIPGLKQFFRLKPPVGGFERKGIKTPFSLGGALGYRKEKINDLIKKMI
ncbi:MAG: 50S ribosomal protein L30 [Nanoarchaeota archaeon]|nr:50S ribosomal protein L30 [Nanoarchaeota archaeon]